MQVGFYFDQTRCTGCSACRVACKDCHDIPAGPENWMRIAYTEQGEVPEVFVSYLVLPCFQCLKPICVEACPVGAISKREADGIVVVDREACLGNEACDEKCRKACPYDAPQFGPTPGAKMGKCDFCLDLWTQGKLPACIESCPTRALDAGPLADLEGRYGTVHESLDFRYSERTRPAVVLRPKAPRG